MLNLLINSMTWHVYNIVNCLLIGCLQMLVLVYEASWVRNDWRLLNDSALIK